MLAPLPLAAHSMTGDRERCLAAGMDDFRSRPVRGADPGTGAAAEALGPDVLIEGSVVESLLASCQPGDLEGILDIFAADAPVLLSEISDAVRRRDADGLRRAAHALKGGASNLGGNRLAVLSERLERAADGDLDDAPALVAQLEPAFRQTNAALYAIARAPQAGAALPSGSNGGDQR